MSNKNNNKSGMVVNPYILIGIVVIIIILVIVLFSKGVFANQVMTSSSQLAQGCNPKNIPVSIKGSGFVKNTALFFGATLEPDRIDISQVTASGRQLSIVGSQDYTWKVTLIDDFTGNIVASDSGKNSHPSDGSQTEDKFGLNFFVPDNDCNNVIDNFEGQIVYNVKTEGSALGLNKPTDNTITRKISFVNGRYVR